MPQISRHILYPLASVKDRNSFLVSKRSPIACRVDYLPACAAAAASPVFL